VTNKYLYLIEHLAGSVAAIELLENLDSLFGHGLSWLFRRALNLTIDPTGVFSYSLPN
jgi:hypothetical protein